MYIVYNYKAGIRNKLTSGCSDSCPFVVCQHQGLKLPNHPTLSVVCSPPHALVTTILLIVHTRGPDVGNDLVVIDDGIESVNVKNRYKGARVSARRANREPEDGIRWKFVHGGVVVVR